MLKNYAVQWLIVVFSLKVIAVAKNNGNILQKPYSEAVRRLDMFIQKRVKIEYEGEVYGYENLCLEWRASGCPGNKHVHIVNDLYEHGINVTFPTVRFGTTLVILLRSYISFIGVFLQSFTTQ